MHFGLAACKLNVHKRCQRNVANTCGIDAKEMAKILATMGISGDKLNTSQKKKVGGAGRLDFSRPAPKTATTWHQFWGGGLLRLTPS